jgi:hypothetical protein
MDHYLILASLYAESKEGWVWLPLSANWSTDLVRITYHNRSVICERRVVDSNFRGIYQREKGAPFPTSENVVIMNAWYRQRLGINDTGVTLPLEIEEVHGFWSKHVSVFQQHPQAMVRTNILIALVSVGLGILGLILGVVSVCRI